MENALPADVVKECLSGLPFTYSQEGTSIFIKPQTPDLSQGLASSTLVLHYPPITGIVRGPDGQPLAGVNVVSKGTKKGVVTDLNGLFSIEAEQEKDTCDLEYRIYCEGD